MTTCRAIEQHEAYKREVSDAAERLLKIVRLKQPWLETDADLFARFIIPKPVDPLKTIANKLGVTVEGLRACVEASGGKMVFEEEG
jgi:hypothetical protein